MDRHYYHMIRMTVLLAIWSICGHNVLFETARAQGKDHGASGSSPLSITTADDRVTFRWAVRSPDVQALRTDLVSKHAELLPEMEPFRPTPAEREEYTDASFAPLMIVGGAVALSVVAETVLSFYRGYQHGGAIIDTRGKDLDIRELPSLPAGSILVVNRDGPPTLLETKSGLDVTALVNAISPAAK